MNFRTASRPSRTSLVGAAFVAMLMALIIGCGGGGGGGGSSSSGTSSSPTTTTTTTTTGSVLGPDMIFYSDEPSGGTTIDYYEVAPTGGTSKLLLTLSDSYEGVAYNPAVSGQVVFGYSPSGATGANFGIYKNSSVSPSGATTLVAPTYSIIQSIQVSFDGAYVYYVAATGAGDAYLYKVSTSGGTPTVLDNSGPITSANVDVVTGTTITYDKLVTYSNGNIEDAVFTLPTTGGTPTQMTVDANNNFSTPQFSKDGTKICLLSDIADPDFEVYVMSSTVPSSNGVGLTQVTNLPAVQKFASGVTFSADGTQTAFIGVGTSNNTGVYLSGLVTATTPGAATLLVNDAYIESGIYWTSTTGRSRGGTTAYLSRPRKKGLIL